MISVWFHFLVLLSYCIRKFSNRSFSFLLNVPNKVIFHYVPFSWNCLLRLICTVTSENLNVFFA